jgi:hypothetical protein
MSQLILRATIFIPAGTSVSERFTIDGKPPNVLEMPTAWTPADISFAGTGDGANFLYIYKENGLILSIPTTLCHRIVLPTKYLSDHLAIMVCSGVPGATVNQAAERKLFLEVWE